MKTDTQRNRDRREKAERADGRSQMKWRAAIVAGLIVAVLLVAMLARKQSDLEVELQDLRGKVEARRMAKFPAAPTVRAENPAAFPESEAPPVAMPATESNEDRLAKLEQVLHGQTDVVEHVRVQLARQEAKNQYPLQMKSIRTALRFVVEGSRATPVKRPSQLPREAAESEAISLDQLFETIRGGDLSR